MLINNDTIIKDDDPRIRMRSEDVPFPVPEESGYDTSYFIKYLKGEKCVCIYL